MSSSKILSSLLSLNLPFEPKCLSALFPALFTNITPRFLRVLIRLAISEIPLDGL